MQVEFTVTGTDSSDLHAKATAMLDEFCTGSDHVSSFGMSAQPLLKTGIGEVCLWEATVVATVHREDPST